MALIRDRSAEAWPRLPELRDGRIITRSSNRNRSTGAPLRLLDLSDGRTITPPAAWGQIVDDCFFGPDDRWVFFTSRTARQDERDAVQRLGIRRLELPDLNIGRIALPDLTVAGPVWPQGVLDECDPFPVCVSPDGGAFATFARDKVEQPRRLVVWDAECFKKIGTVDLPESHTG